MGRSSRKKVKSQIVVPSISDGDKELINRVTNTVASVIGKKRSRSVGDKSNVLESEFSSKRSDNSDKQDKENNLRINTGDLRNKLEEMKELKSQERKISRSRSRSKQQSATKQQSDKNSSGSSGEESEEELKTFRKNGKKFVIERKMDEERNETVTTPLDFEDDISDVERERQNFVKDIRPHDDNSEITFKRKVIEEDDEGRSNRSRKNVTDDENVKKKRRTKSRSRSREERKRSSHKRSKRRHYTSDETSSDESDRDEKRHRRRRSKKHKKRKNNRESSDETSEDEKMSQIIKKVVQQLKGRCHEDITDKLVNETKFQSPEKQKSVTGTAKSPENVNSPVKSPIKSPSDSLMIYKPALNMVTQRIPQSRFTYNSEASPTMIGNSMIQERNSDKAEFKVEEIDKILKSFRLDQQEAGTSKATKTAAEKLQEEREAYAKEISNKAIIEAEKNKAELIHPQGMSVNDIKIPPNVQLSVVDTDDDFLHIVCHIEPQLVIKIQKGEFVELEKLLQKPEHLRYEDESKRIVIEKEGERFCVPCKKENKISNVRKWEQAFRVYATIYSQANPVRASEIWQYVEVINQAAAKFRWENVARYDYIFRHLMARNPQRSWAKTYTQMWTLELCGGDNQNANHGRGSSNNYKKPHSNNGSGNGNGQGHSWRDNCCWKFNKGDQCLYGKNCRFDHRCTYCGSYSHPSMACPKKGGNASQGGKKKRRSSSRSEDSKSESQN